MSEHVLPPHSDMAEETVLGSALSEPDRMPDLLTRLGPRPFYIETRNMIWAAMSELLRQEHTFTWSRVVDYMHSEGTLSEIGGQEVLFDLLRCIEFGVPFTNHLTEVLRTARLRALIKSCQEVVQAAYEPNANPDEVAGVMQDGAVKELRLYGGRAEHIAEPLGRLIDREANPVVRVGTGLACLDGIYRGAGPGDLVVIASRPGMGKTSLALQWAQHAAKEYGATAFLSLEMTAEELSARALSKDVGIPGSEIADGRIPEEVYPKFLRAAEALSALPLWIAEPVGTLDGLVAEIRRLVAVADIRVIVVDYLQLLIHRVKGRSVQRYLELGLITRALKLLARALGIAIILVSQLSRKAEDRPDKRPMLSDLRESGAIEQDSDTVFLLFREGYYDKDCENENAAEVIIAKYRAGPSGKTIPVMWNAQTTVFRTPLSDDVLEEMMQAGLPL